VTQRYWAAADVFGIVKSKGTKRNGIPLFDGRIIMASFNRALASTALILANIGGSDIDAESRASVTGNQTAEAIAACYCVRRNYLVNP